MQAQPEIVAFDVEGTLTSGQTWQGMRDYLIAFEQDEKYRRFFRRYIPRLFLFKIGLKDEQTFKEQWILDILRLFTDYTEAEFQQMAGWVVEQTLWPNRRDQIVEELKTHREHGRTILLASGLAQPILELLALKVDAHALGTPLLFENGRFTGEAAGPLNVGEKKADRLREWLNGAPLYAAYGDTNADMNMLTLSQHTVAVHPDNDLRRAADENGWRIID